MRGGGNLWRNSRHLLQICTYLKESGPFWKYSWKPQKYFFKNHKLGGGCNELKSLVENSKFGNYRPPTITVGRVWVSCELPILRMRYVISRWWCCGQELSHLCGNAPQKLSLVSKWEIDQKNRNWESLALPTRPFLITTYGTYTKFWSCANVNVFSTEENDEA